MNSEEEKQKTDDSENIPEEISSQDENELTNSSDSENTSIENKDGSENALTLEEDINSDENLEDDLLEFSEMDEFSPEELKDIQDALNENLQSEENEIEAEGSDIPEFNPEIGADLEAKIQQELLDKRKAQGVKTVSRDSFIQYLSERRNKIVYHALWHLAFNVDDHQSTKAGLYEALKDVTSKNPVEPIEEHKFYFGLGFILRLKLFDQKVVQFQKDKLKMMVNIANMQEILKLVGDPISERPILSKAEKKSMFQDFLSDDFLDI